MKIFCSKLLVITLLLLFGLGISIAQDRKKKTVEEKKIKLETRWNYQIESGTPSNTGIKASTIQYNQDTQRKNWILFDKEGREKYVYTYEYSKNTTNCYRTDNNGKKVLDYVQEYDNAGHLIKEIRYTGNGELKDILQITLDDTGVPIKEERLNAKKEKTLEVSYIYDRNNNKVYKTLKDYQANKFFEIVLEKDAQGKVIVRKLYDASGPLMEHTVQVWDDKGIIKQRISYDNNGDLLRKEVYSLDEITQSRTESIFMGKTSNLVSFVVYTYEYY
ncbi:MAG: hypothetical protein MK212_00590 [Saprospiraceae bacterium]|nr:hypothetical protein [Saprospiraceae bacterium]